MPTSASSWEEQILSLSDGLELPPPREYLAGSLFPRPSLSLLFGAPGSLKSLFLMDLSVCVAAGKDWLGEFPTRQGSVLWLDKDSGRDRLIRRFLALLKGHDLERCPVDFLAFPQPTFVAGGPGAAEAVHRLISLAERKGYSLIVLDNLGSVSGARDENSPEMIEVMGRLRFITEETGAAVIVIHHKTKGRRDRPGDMLRGHSSIEGALDLALFLERKGEYLVHIQATKSRDIMPEPFYAQFLYESQNNELTWCRFKITQATHLDKLASLAQQALPLLVPGTGLTKQSIILANALGISKHAAKQVILHLEKTGKITLKPGPRNSRVISLNEIPVKVEE